MKGLTDIQIYRLGLGYSILEENGKLVEVEPQKPYKEEYIKYKTKLINEEFQKKVESLHSGYSDYEVSTWDKKYTEAKLVVDGGNSDYISSLCILNESPLDLSKKIIEKQERYNSLYTKFEKKKREELYNLTIS